ncbi:phage head-tail connector protein [Companilactobacillus allii]|uniref:Phage head-tail adapter protein n=1 Tax=Companilactobacillus allii TaxID=1847728 RepID=A0A1P8Q2I7_9LACO|nr:phage head-tail connector protein [Companilactobacillus allii]APX72080.1 hypothetical protein BTM29_05660 [Companilactobacillus allii]USQ69173.1 phage head-tail connector protein [Companilactobacillus allii]
MVEEIESNILNDFKVQKGIKDTEMDEILKIYIHQAIQEVELYIGESKLPDILSGIITQMAEGKFTKAGAEGTTATSEEGLSYTFSANDLTPFLPSIDGYIRNKIGSKSIGKVVTFD